MLPQEPLCGNRISARRLTSLCSVRWGWTTFWVLVGLVLTTAGAITAARFGQPPAGVGARLVAFTPYAAVLYAVAGVALLVMAGRVEGRLRALGRVLAGLTAAGVGLHALWLAPAFLGEAETPVGEGLRVLTVNLLEGGADPERVVGLAQGYRVDVLVLQEVTPAALAGLERAGLTATLPRSAGEPRAGAAGTMVFARSPLRDVRRVPTSLGSWAMTLADGTRLVAAHTAPPVGDGETWADDHRAIRSSVAAYDGPAVVAGDLNATTDHAVLHELRGRGLADAAALVGAGWQPTWPASDGPRLLGLPLPPMLALDHVLVSDAFRVVSTETADVGGTDHRALVAILTR